MTLESRPQLRYARIDADRGPVAAPEIVREPSPAPAPEATLVKALELARQLEELLEDTRSVAGGFGAAHADDARSHSTRMARAMAAGLVDELEAIVRPARKSGIA